MDYLKINFTLEPNIKEASEIMMAQLGELGFESFVETKTGFEAYIPEEQFTPGSIDNLFIPFDNVKINFTKESITDRNWNKTWEENYFNPISIGNDVLIRGSFHNPAKDVKYEIVIDPKMAFGTGHHETTGLMIKHILETDMNGKKVLDMGCGTGILGILCSMAGAAEVTGIDIEDWAYHNAIENCQKNGIQNMKVIHGDASDIDSTEYDIVLANINRNILLNDISKYSKVLRSGGILYLSGFYESDLNVINNETKKHNLSFISSKRDNNWLASSYRKE
jgi:ribosomal protein L11 methyltransferase